LGELIKGHFKATSSLFPSEQEDQRVISVLKQLARGAISERVGEQQILSDHLLKHIGDQQ